MKTQFFYLFLAIGLVFSQSCDEIDNLSGGASSPEVTYSATTYDAEFFKAGSSATPSIDWNGSQGSVTLGSNIDGLGVNSTTGQLQWTKMLPPGTHFIEVVVSNSEGQVVIPMTIDNPPSGNFEGTYAGSFDYSVTLMEDGTMTAFADGENAAGTWKIENGEFWALYSYDNYPDFQYTLLGAFELSNSSAKLTGDYYNGAYSSGDKPLGPFDVTLQ
ncbi:hypothetical protein CLV84_0440 [Neolewinella xylanilytica]|uniref:Uncharacterized protein n=1 Tax=Neolewinella xylanilytica TaxID=1514080 RepID=A0A2S6I7M9_9BACT|nr:hypothetical protein [Neolewinella xylanilytica]PPK87497.1 hypothetical protein CLV84_0440 [Neolewinella xylanilytica]